MSITDLVDGGGIEAPRFELRNLDDTETLTTIDLTITATTTAGSFDTRMNRASATWVEETVNGGITPDGTLIKKTRGFRYHETLTTALMSLSDLANVKAILSHPYHIKYYPNKDNLTKWLYVKKTGNYDWVNQNIQYPYYQGAISVVSVMTVSAIPHEFDELHIMYQPDWAAGFSAAEKALSFRIMFNTDWDAGNFSTAEKGYAHGITRSPGKAYRDGKVSHK